MTINHQPSTTTNHQMITQTDLQAALTAALEHDEPRPASIPPAPPAGEPHPDSIGITQCSWCRRYQLGGYWVRLDDPPRAQFTHGICPPCAAEQRATLEALAPAAAPAAPSAPASANSHFSLQPLAFSLPLVALQILREEIERELQANPALDAAPLLAETETLANFLRHRSQSHP